MSEITQYQKLTRDTYKTIWILYIIGFILALISVGTLLPITIILVAIGQCYFLPKASKYEKKVKELQAKGGF